MSDRHPKWKRVEPGTVIPAGQPYLIEYDEPNAEGMTRAEYVRYKGTTVSGAGNQRVFVDSSWVPPLVLPTEPTWGIAVGQVRAIGHLWRLSRGSYLIADGYSWPVHTVLDFIPLTDEQVARIEAHRTPRFPSQEDAFR